MCAYTHIFFLLFSWLAPWAMLDLRILTSSASDNFFSHPTSNKLFKNEVENVLIKLRANDKRNWPSFLSPEGTAYDELELDKGLFHGHIFLHVRPPFHFYILSSSSDVFQGLHAIFMGKSLVFTGHQSA